MALDRYTLSRGYVAASRLNLQHFLWKETLGYTFHPKVPALDASTRIADVGTGTGIWLLDLAKNIPSTVKLDGFDISDEQFPKKTPNNVSLSVLNAFEDLSLSPSLIGQYDIVHVRLMMCAVQDNNPLSLFRHSMSLLKPGGYLQWEEYNLEQDKIISYNASSPTDKLTEASRSMRADWPTSWVARLPQICKEQSLQDVSVENHRPTEWYAKMSAELDCMARDEFARQVFDRRGLKAKGDKSRRQIAATYREVEQGSSISHLFQVVVGKKPPVDRTMTVQIPKQDH